MAYNINHIHLKTEDPKKTADWWVKAFNFQILSDDTRPVGDRFIRCQAEDGTKVNISSAKPGDKMGPADGGLHYGLEHIGVETADIDAEIKRIESMGGKLQEGPSGGLGGMRIAFMELPDGIRIELMQPGS